MVDYMTQMAQNKMGEAIQQEQLVFDKRVEQLKQQLNNFKTKAGQTEYTPASMPNATFTINDETKTLMLNLAVANEQKLRAVVDDFKAFLDVILN